MLAHDFSRGEKMINEAPTVLTVYSSTLAKIKTVETVKYFLIFNIPRLKSWANILIFFWSNAILI